MHLEHLTLNTGHTRPSPRSEVGHGIVDALRPLATNGQHEIPQTGGCTVRVTRVPGAALFTVYAPARISPDPHPLVTCGVAWTADAAPQLWTHVEKTYHVITEAGGGMMLPAGNASPDMPATLPWLAVILMPGIAYPLAAGSRSKPFDEKLTAWLGDFERCLAWTLIETAP